MHFPYPSLRSLFILCCLFPLLTPLLAAGQQTHRPAEWQEVAPGVWRLRIGHPERHTPATLLPPSPRFESMWRLPRPGSEAIPELTSEQRGRRLLVGLPLAADEELFGMGVQLYSVTQRKASASELMQAPAGRKRFLKCNSDPPADTGEAHAPSPFYISSRGYGLLVDSARYVTFHCGSTVKERIEIEIPAEGVDLYFYAGPTPMAVIQRHNLHWGGGVMPPRWGLGFWYRPEQFRNAEQILEIAGEFRRRGIPCDVMGPEPGWQAHYYPCDFKWSDKFPDPEAFIKALTASGYRLNLWEHVFVSPHADIHDALAPLSGDRKVWGGLTPDFAMPEARRLFAEDHRTKHVDLGVSGYKLDATDGSDYSVHWSFPDYTKFPSGMDGEQVHQMLGPLQSDVIHSIFVEENRRDYHLVRSAYAGMPSLPFVLFSDLYTWQCYLRATINAGYSGMLWCPEVRDIGPPEEFVRRSQLTMWAPLAMINAWYDGVKPWDKGPEVERIFREAARWRMRLQPYLYSAFREYYENGIPPVRGLVLDYPEDPKVRTIENQFLVGPSLMVCAKWGGAGKLEVYLPGGQWYDFWTGVPYEGGRKITVDVPLEHLPVFVKEGGIIPLGPALDHAPAPGEKIELEIRYYGAVPTSFMLYDDDGETFNFQRGEFGIMHLGLMDDEGALRPYEAMVREWPGWRYAVGEWKSMAQTAGPEAE